MRQMSKGHNYGCVISINNLHILYWVIYIYFELLDGILYFITWTPVIENVEIQAWWLRKLLGTEIKKTDLLADTGSSPPDYPHSEATSSSVLTSCQQLFSLSTHSCILCGKFCLKELVYLFFFGYLMVIVIIKINSVH